MRIARVIDDKGALTHAALKPDGTARKLNGDSFTTFAESGEPVEIRAWLAPIDPEAIICVGANYRAHIEECGDENVPDYPILFMKNPASANAHLRPIHLPRLCENEVDYEGELAVVIGKACRNVSRENVWDYVLGFTAANDVSARIWQLHKGGGQWCRGKGFDGFCPLGPALVTTDEIQSPGNLRITTTLNGEIVQDGNTNLMIFDIPTLISFISQDTTLLPGTVILSGTPAGVGWTREPKLLLQDGDTVCVDIENIGKLINPVQKSR